LSSTFSVAAQLYLEMSPYRNEDHAIYYWVILQET